MFAGFRAQKSFCGWASARRWCPEPGPYPASGDGRSQCCVAAGLRIWQFRMIQAVCGRQAAYVGLLGSALAACPMVIVVVCTCFRGVCSTEPTAVVCAGEFAIVAKAMVDCLAAGDKSPHPSEANNLCSRAT